VGSAFRESAAKNNNNTITEKSGLESNFGKGFVEKSSYDIQECFHIFLLPPWVTAEPLR